MLILGKMYVLYASNIFIFGHTVSILVIYYIILWRALSSRDIYPLYGFIAKCCRPPGCSTAWMYFSFFFTFFILKSKDVYLDKQWDWTGFQTGVIYNPKGENEAREHLLCMYVSVSQSCVFICAWQKQAWAHTVDVSLCTSLSSLLLYHYLQID